MTDPDTISADYTLRPSELAATLALLVEARQPTLVWGPPGTAKSMIAQQVAADAGRRYVDVRALLLDPVDLRGIPWRDSADRTRWAPPAFLPPTDDPGRWLINLEELPSAVQMVQAAQAALYQLVLDRKVGEYELPEGASLIACGNRESDRGVVHRMPTPLASRFVHLEIRVDAQDWLAWGAANGIAPEVLFYIQMRPDMLHLFDPQSREKAFCCPRTWEMVSNIVNRRNGLDPSVERALFRGTVGEAAAVEFSAFLEVWRELPHPRAVIDDPENAVVPENASALIALCGSLYRMADGINLGAIVTYATRLRREIGEFLVGSCKRTTGTAPEAMMSASTCPGPTEGSWSTSPTISNAASSGTAASSARISMTSTMDVSSTASRPQSSGFSPSRLNPPVLGSTSSRRCMVFASRPVASLSLRHIPVIKPCSRRRSFERSSLAGSRAAG